ncbi:transposase family protein, partial [Pontibacter sp. BT213]|nr:transposase family protein [Pontibacter fetidus]
MKAGPLSSIFRKLICLGKGEQMQNSEVSLLACLREVPDFRRPQGRRYPLAETLCMMVMSIMSGCC